MKLFISFVAFFISFTLLSQQKSNSLIGENLKGSIKSFEIKTLIVDKATGELTQKYAEKHFFDSLGNLEKIENYGYDTKLDTKTVFNYENGFLMAETTYNASGKKDKTTLYEYDADKRLSTQKKYNNLGKLQYQITYFYNQQGQLSAEHKLIPSINYTMKESFKYDESGNMIEASKATRIGASKETFTYNNQGQITKKSEYNAMGELFSIITYDYNEQGDKVSLKKYDALGELTYFEDYQYQYDSKANWTERANFEKGKKVSVEKRTFTY
jgi:hypothetical protein